jgi:hypothetical protein
MRYFLCAEQLPLISRFKRNTFKLYLGWEEMLGSNLDPDTDHYDRGVSWFTLVPPSKFWNILLQAGHGLVLAHNFQLIHYHPVTRRHIAGVTGSFVK